MAGGYEQTVQKWMAIGVLAVVFVLAFGVGRASHNRATKNIVTRLDLTRSRFQQCESERTMLRGDPSKIDTLKLAESEHAALKQENELLTQDNEELSNEISVLEREEDDLHAALDMKGFVTDDEVEELEETMALGNDSRELKELLEEAEDFTDQVTKDEFITRLIAELTRKTTNLGKCVVTKRVTAPLGSELLWKELSPEQQAASLRVAIKKIVHWKEKDPTVANSLIEKWADRHPEKLQGLLRTIDEQMKQTSPKQQQEDDWGEVDWDEWPAEDEAIAPEDTGRRR